MTCAGAVLAGGRSQRMGFDKALLSWGGEPLWRRQMRVLREAGAEPVALVRAPAQEDFGAICWRDRRVNQGPLAGLEAALLQAREAERGALLALAIDMPFTQPEWFHWMLQAAPDGAVAEHDGIYEPLAAVYPAAVLSVVQRRLDAGQRSLQGLIAELVALRLVRSLPVPKAYLPQIQSVNTVKPCLSTTVTSLSRPRDPDFTK